MCDWHEVSTVKVCRLRPVFHSVTHRAAGSDRPLCHGTRFRLCRCAASLPQDRLSSRHSSGRGVGVCRTAHSVTARGVDCAGVLLSPARLSFSHSSGCGIGPPTVSRLLVPSVWPAPPLSPFRPPPCLPSGLAGVDFTPTRIRTYRADVE